ncbi:hypothetical protein Maes01_01716 [Microbulbifer aestuariivivens]|uniref:DUF1249 domain-containing protein n=1 Tax=Microbulbifer aestuariivivens TaxID=1908308 RepID=A0ABP9WPN0_9GAMM
MTPRKNLASIERKVGDLISKSRAKSAYQVDLPAYHADCDANYLRLCKLLPELPTRGQWRYQMPHGALELSVLERSRYTTEVCLSASTHPADGGEGCERHKGGDGHKDWMAPPKLTVRLYHDARMAEVVAVDGRGPLPEPAASAPRGERRRPQGADERQQANRFLGEWLGHCLANGRTEFELILDGRRL